MRPVLTKLDFVKRYAANEFGNRSPTWDTLFDWCEGTMAEDNLALYHIRNRVAGAMTWYDVPKWAMAETWEVATKQFDPELLYISAMAPTHLTVLQGEVFVNGLGQLSLYYSKVKKPMRDSLVEGGKQVSGLLATKLIDAVMNYRSHSWLNYLLQSYPGHVVEFSSYSRCWGTVPGMNTVFWEVRNY